MRLLEAVLAAPERAAGLGIAPEALSTPGFTAWYRSLRRLEPPEDEATVFTVLFVDAVKGISQLPMRAARQLQAATENRDLPYSRQEVGAILIRADQLVKGVRQYAKEHHMPRCAGAASLALRSPHGAGSGLTA